MTRSKRKLILNALNDVERLAARLEKLGLSDAASCLEDAQMSIGMEILCEDCGDVDCDGCPSSPDEVREK